MLEFDYKLCAEVELENCSKVIQQYVKLRRENLDFVVFFRLGEFYETYFEDAILISKECEVALTKRDLGNKNGTIPMAGVPYRSINSYIKKLLDRNYKVAICEQGDGKDDSGILERKIVRKYTSGTILDDEFLDFEESNYIAALYEEKGEFGLAYCDLATGEFNVTVGNFSDIQAELFKISPREILTPLKAREIKPFSVIEKPETSLPQDLISPFNITIVPQKYFSFSLIKPAVPEFGLGYKSANAIVNYVIETQKNFAPKLDKISTYHIADYLILDEVARRNLELTKNIFDFKKHGSLFWAIDNTKTSMGARLLKNWINQPLVDIVKITTRQNAIKELLKKPILACEIDKILDSCYDISRLATKISNNTITFKDFLALKATLFTIMPLKSVCKNFSSPILNFLNEGHDLLFDFAQILENTIQDDSEAVIKNGASAELDFIRGNILKVEKWFEDYETQLREQTGAKGLKVLSNKVFGYFIELPSTQVKLALENFKRKQTLSNSERFYTDILMEHEQQIFYLKSKANELEADIYSKLREYSHSLIESIRSFAANLMQLDVIFSLYKTARDNNYICPIINTDGIFDLKDGRHPSIEKIVDKFTPNSIDFGSPFKLLTGPNMAGKSTYMRSCAIITILAQIGSFVPAQSANMPIVDKIFVRIASCDNLTKNNSTFMVEMLEAAYILNHATKNSLILLDELGKGTSTLDGVALARSIAEYIIENIGAKTVFATHYHELKVLSDSSVFVENLMVNLPHRRVEKGFMDKSYGINVARMAKLPDDVIERAQKYLAASHIKQITD